MDKDLKPKVELTDEELMDMVGGFDVAADETISADTVTVSVDKYYKPFMKYGIKPVAKYGVKPVTKYGIVVAKYGVQLMYGIIPDDQYGTILK
ncbi:hypothetical protein [Pseudobacteroides cellulosolvens]|uniref:Uncharacterized protein n=1 Tax=Pseudobacteroides cellulosolvens ATCC 35603 = DSM 2933 TaxID=398512 RepID=A0A0L6JKN1_9FIRM|nr:hypothetical protein [Pseudobacteroides cellulosolvens]KNY25937.1 hypothetical protein Bccel_1197 [Pseudobacteroides cellulosolvens ATCC 35603 = DSM 2933]